MAKLSTDELLDAFKEMTLIELPVIDYKIQVFQDLTLCHPTFLGTVLYTEPRQPC